MKQKQNRKAKRFDDIRDMMRPKARPQRPEPEFEPAFVPKELDDERIQRLTGMSLYGSRKPEPVLMDFPPLREEPLMHNFILVGDRSVERVIMTKIKDMPAFFELVPPPYRDNAADMSTDLSQRHTDILLDAIGRMSSDAELRSKMFEQVQSFVVMPHKIIAFDNEPTPGEFAELVREALNPKPLTPFPDFKPKSMP